MLKGVSRQSTNFFVGVESWWNILVLWLLHFIMLSVFCIIKKISIYIQNVFESWLVGIRETLTIVHFSQCLLYTYLINNKYCIKLFIWIAICRCKSIIMLLCNCIVCYISLDTNERYHIVNNIASFVLNFITAWFESDCIFPIITVWLLLVRY